MKAGDACRGVDVWWLEDVTDFADTFSSLSTVERDRAAAFVFEADRKRFIARRSVVKYLLSALHGCEPSEVALGINTYGKPVITTGPYVFNTSSSGDSLLVAVGRRSEVGEIGVDLETMRSMPDALLIAQHFFSAVEMEQLRRLSGDALQRAFFNCWTRKEALVKAFGSGLSFDFNRFSVTMLAHEPARILQLDGEACHWHLRGWTPTQRHIAALATQIAPAEVRMHCVSTNSRLQPLAFAPAVD